MTYKLLPFLLKCLRFLGCFPFLENGRGNFQFHVQWLLWSLLIHINQFGLIYSGSSSLFRVSPEDDIGNFAINLIMRMCFLVLALYSFGFIFNKSLLGRGFHTFLEADKSVVNFKYVFALILFHAPASCCACYLLYHDMEGAHMVNRMIMVTSMMMMSAIMTTQYTALGVFINRLANQISDVISVGVKLKFGTFDSMKYLDNRGNHLSLLSVELKLSEVGLMKTK